MHKGNAFLPSARVQDCRRRTLRSIYNGTLRLTLTVKSQGITTMKSVPLCRIGSQVPKIEYEKDTHTYKEDGLVRLSCTQILADNGLTGLDGVSQSLLEANGQFGKAVHAAVQFKCKGTLDLKTVDQPILEYLKCWDNFVEDFGYQSVEQEVFGIHPKYHFGYQVDQIGLLGNGKYIG